MPQTADAAPILFKEHTAAELHALLAPVGVTERLARRLQSAVVRRGDAEVPRQPRRHAQRGQALQQAVGGVVLEQRRRLG